MPLGVTGLLCLPTATTHPSWSTPGPTPLSLTCLASEGVCFELSALATSSYLQKNLLCASKRCDGLSWENSSMQLCSYADNISVSLSY